MTSNESQQVHTEALPFHLSGTGATVLLIHGFTASPTEVRPLGNFLHSHGYDIYSVLLAGHGTTPEDLRNTTWQDWWQSVQQKFEEIPQCTIVIGLSMGGLFAARLAAENPQQLTKLVLLATPMRLKTHMTYLLPFLSHIKPFQFKGEDTVAYFQQHKLWSYHYRPLAAGWQLHKLIQFSRKNIIPRVTTPTLIVQGLLDESVYPDSYQIIQHQISAKKVETLLLPNSHHIVTVESDKEQLFAAILQFLQ